MEPIIPTIAVLAGLLSGTYLGRKLAPEKIKEIVKTVIKTEEVPIDIDIEALEDFEFEDFDLNELLAGLTQEEIDNLMEMFKGDIPTGLHINKTIIKTIIEYRIKYVQKKMILDRNVLDQPEPLTLRWFQKEALTAISKTIKGIIQLPTGTGKSIILSRAIGEEMKTTEYTPLVYVILSPKIILSNQLMISVRKDLILNERECEYFIIHSDKTEIEDDDPDLEWFKAEAGSWFTTIPAASTNVLELQAAYHRAKENGKPLVISSTYHSAGLIAEAKIPVHFTGCDEAHRIAVPDNGKDNFGWIADGFNSDKMFFFTATLRVTDSDTDFGMTNIEQYGELLYHKTPKEMIEAGEIVQPILHQIDIENGTDQAIDDVYAVVEGFKKHRSEINYGAKMLVVARKGSKGSSHLDMLAQSDEIKQLRYTHPNLTIFDISTRHKPRIDGIEVSKPKFLKELQELGRDSSKEAIIIHINILSEGIDVPGITGEMFFAAPPKIKFMQTLGRGARLHPIDRERLYSGEIKPEQANMMIKPYNWVIIPRYNDQKDRFTEITIPLVQAMRKDYDFNENHLVTTHYRQLSSMPKRAKKDMTKAHKSDASAVEFDEFKGTVIHEIEKTSNLKRIADNRAKMKTCSPDDLIEMMLNMNTTEPTNKNTPNTTMWENDD